MPTDWKSSPNYTSQVVIASGQTTSAALDLAGKTPCGVYLPAALTGTALTFLVSHDGSTYVTVATGAGADYSVTVAADKYVPLDYTKFLGVRYLKLKSGSTELAARTIQVATRRF